MRKQWRLKAKKKNLEAELLMMEDAPIAVIWYDEGYRLLKGNIKNCYGNAMQYRDFTEVYLIPAER